MNPINIQDKLDSFSEHWSPKIIAELNGQEVKLAKFQGKFDWHAHANEDELFYVLDGSFTMEFRDRIVNVPTGHMIVVPKGVEHRPVATEECSVMLFEPKGLINTGDNESSERTTDAEWIA